MRSCVFLFVAAALVGLSGTDSSAQEPCGEVARALADLQRRHQDLEHRLDQLAKAIDDVLWFQRVADVAVVDKWRILGPPDANPRNPTAPGASNPIKFYTYTFLPRQRPAGQKIPLVVLPHGGVHADFNTYYTHIVRELVSQGYAVVAPEYRGSTGYGRAFWELVDYGGREVEDVHAARRWAIEVLPDIDPQRVGLVGWSHGGLIALQASFTHPDDYACVFAGVPVANLVMRMGYQDESYRQLFSAPYHVGATVRQNLEEYKRRSPVYHAHRLAVPLLIHTTTDDEDVNFIEVEHLIQALKAAGKKFEYKIWPAGTGGHSHDRLDTPQARAARREIYAFLARYLKPPRPVQFDP